MKRWLIEKLGGYATVEDALNSAENKHEILTKAVAHLFNAVTEEDIFRKDRTTYTYKGKPLMASQLSVLENQAKDFTESELFKMLDLELQYQANRKMYFDSRGNDDLIAGKLILWNWDVVKTKLKNLSNSRH